MPRPKYCWDTSVFLAILCNEEKSQEEAAGLLEVIDLADSGRITVIAPTSLLSEVLDTPRGPEARDKLNRLFLRSGYVMQDVNLPIASLAGELRMRARDEGRTLRTIDSHFIATALVHSVDALHSFDRDHLKLDGLPIVNGLHVTKPKGSQTLLDLG